MHNIAIAASLLVGSYLLFAIVNAFTTSRSHARRAKQLGCQPAFFKPNKWPYGLDQVWQLIQADKRNEVPTEVLKILRATGHSTVEMQAPNTSIMTTDPKNIQAILATQFEDFDLGGRRRKYFLPLLGNGIFTADGHFWSRSRALLRPQFVREQVSKLGLLEIHVQLMFKHLEVDSTGWTPELELSALFFRLTMDSATEFLFGQSANSQLAALPGSLKDKPLLKVNNQEDLSSVGRAFDDATHGLGIRARLGPLYKLYNPKSFRESCQTVHQFADRYVQLALKRDESKSMSGVEQTDEQGKYVFLDELVKSTRDPIELRSQLLNILLAGRDTTAGLLGWTFYLLARHPDVYRKLRTTVTETFGNYNNVKEFSFASLKACSYLQHVMNEVLRLYPSVPLNTREANKNTTLPRGGGPDGLAPVYIWKGQSVGYSVHTMHRSKDLWGEDAEEFRPDRWVNYRHGWEYLPFNGGPRICLGQQFALTEAGYVIARMVQRFDEIENLDFSTEVKFQYSVTSAPLGVNVRLHAAS